MCCLATLLALTSGFSSGGCMIDSFSHTASSNLKYCTKHNKACNIWHTYMLTYHTTLTKHKPLGINNRSLRLDNDISYAYYCTPQCSNCSKVYSIQRVSLKRKWSINAMATSSEFPEAPYMIEDGLASDLISLSNLQPPSTLPW